MLRAYKKVSTDDKDLSKVQQNVEQALQPVLASEIVNGILLPNLALTAGSVNTIEHRLGRTLLGYIVVGKSAPADIWDNQAENVFKSRTLLLECSSDCTVSLWVF